MVPLGCGQKRAVPGRHDPQADPQPWEIAGAESVCVHPRAIRRAGAALPTVAKRECHGISRLTGQDESWDTDRLAVKSELDNLAVRHTQTSRGAGAQERSVLPGEL